MFEKIKEINARPDVFSVYTADSLWTDEHRSKQMLAYHLNEEIDFSSRNIDFINRSASWIIDRFRLGPGKAVCDFGCGPGLYTSRLARSGAEVTGLDFSENSIRYAWEQAAAAGQAINYIHTNYLTFDPKDQFDLIVMIWCDFCALSPAQRKKLLSIFHQCLKAGGAILLDAYSMAAYGAREEASFYEKNQLDHFWCEDDYYCFVNTFKYDDEAVVLDKYSIFPERGEPETVYNWLQYFTQAGLEDEFSAAGFDVKDVLGDVAGGPFSDQNPEFAIVAQKTP